MRGVWVAAVLGVGLGTGTASAQEVAETRAATVRIQSFSVIVPDYDVAKQWYVEKLGFAVVRDSPFGNGERFLMVAPRGQTDVGIVLQRPRSGGAPNDVMPDYTDRIGKVVNVVLVVSDVTAYASMLERNGVTLTSKPAEMPWGAQATFRDLYGNSFVIVGPLRARAPGG